MGAFPYRNLLTIVLLAGSILFAGLMSLPVKAQGCQNDPCFNTPTGTATGTATPTPGPGTPTAVPMPATVVFPHPDYAVPTSIPVMNLPTASPNGYNPPTLALPSPLAIEYTPPPFATPSMGVVTATLLLTINTGLSISHTTPLTFGPSGLISGSASYTLVEQISGQTNGVISDVVSYTTYLSDTAAALNPTETFTISSAPAWYAPELPRPAADVGWTFEQMQGDIDAGRRYSLPTWAGFAGYVASLPFQLVKLIYQIVQFLGPLGLFVTWLLVMFPVVLWFRFFLFIKNLFVSLLNFIIKIITLILDLIRTFADLFIPW